VIRLGAVAFPLAPMTGDAWAAAVRARVRTAVDQGAALVLFPEYATAGLLPNGPWERWDGLWRDTARAAAQEHGCTVVLGSHLVRTAHGPRNRVAVVRPDGSGWDQDKMHPTPWERGWDLAPTTDLVVAEAAGARIAVLTCYDVEFPEACRAAARAGAEILLVPSWTDDHHGFHRVRRCAAARCIENACAVVHAPLVGGLDDPPGFEQACGAAGILTPCDTGWPPDGIAAAGHLDHATVVVGAVDLAAIRRARTAGTVTPLVDARPESGYCVRSAQ
jgi:predicted amidohydrolase